MRRSKPPCLGKPTSLLPPALLLSSLWNGALPCATPLSCYRRMHLPRHVERLKHSARRRTVRHARRLNIERLEARAVAAGDVFTPLAGDWDGDGRDSIGLFNTSTGEFALRDINAPGFPHRVVTPAVKISGALPIAGDWDGDGRDSPGVYDAALSRVVLFDESGALYAEKPVAPISGALPIAGDWNGDRRDDVGLYSMTARSITLYYDNAAHAVSFDHLPTSGALEPLAGDFHGDQRDEIALYHRDTQQFYIAGHATRQLALPTDAPQSMVLMGDWGGHRSSLPGWFRQDTGTFTPWHTWEEDRFSAPLYAVPSNQVQAHVDLPLIAPWKNGIHAPDVDDDGLLSPIDALLVINSLNSFGPRSLPDFRASSSNYVGYLDTNGDGFLAPIDALLVINALNSYGSGKLQTEPPPPPAVFPQLSDAEVATLLDRASAASNSTDAIIAVVDRGGRILGVRAESSVLATFAGDPHGLIFAIDGAVAKARTAAFFSSDQAPLTSRTVRFISQSTVTQREMQSNPNVGDMTSALQGPGFVAPVGLGGHFPPGVNFTPPVDLFAIEHTNRDSIIHPGVDGIKGTADDLLLDSRFNVDPAYIPLGQEIEAPESYGYTSGRYIDAQSRGIATLPGGVPLYRNGTLVGGVGVFFPGSDGTATFEQGFVAGVGQTELARTNAPKVLEAEWIAFATAGGVASADFPGAQIDTLNGVPLPTGIRLPEGRIDLVGITLEIYGPNPSAANPARGIDRLLQVGSTVAAGGASSGANQAVGVGADDMPNNGDDPITRGGLPVPSGWLVLPHGSGSLSAADVETIIMQGLHEATLVRAAIRLPIGQRTKMVFSVSDLDGNVLGLYRMPDATVFSIDVAVAKARNEAYYADASALLPVDRVDDNRDGIPDPNVPAGAALTARTFRFLAEPRYPAGIDGTTAGAFSMLRDPGITPATAENLGAPLPANVYTSILGFDAFHVGRNFRDPGDMTNGVGNQNGIVFFPGSTPLYVGGGIAGGLGVSGDGVDQDDVVTYYASVGYQTPQALRADQFYVRGVRLPFQKFLRNPHG